MAISPQTLIRRLALVLREANAVEPADQGRIRKFRFAALVVLSVLSIALLPTQDASGLEIRIDYTYDTGNFFNTQEKRDAIEAVADFYGAMINDTLLRINPADFPSASWSATITHPATGASQPIPGLVVPENVIIVYVGARELGGTTAGSGGPGGFSAGGFSPWFERIRGRGSAAAAVSPASLRTDFALWGGSISFDNPRVWNFSQTGNGSGTEFISVALHEMGHVLGLGTADSWNNLLSAGTFTGAAVQASFGGSPGANSGHFLGSLTSRIFGSFSATHGVLRPVLMLPSFTDTGANFDVATDLDLSAMVDVGWDLTPPTHLLATTLSPDDASFTWQSVSFKNYEIERTADLMIAFSGASGEVSGDGTIQSWSDPAPPLNKAFYRLRHSDPVGMAAAAVVRSSAAMALDNEYRTISEPPRTVDCNETPPSP